jgi:putative toxin-antitoxin system antitoxin component (TIGR02293 family)
MNKALQTDFTYSDIERGIPARTVRDLERAKVLSASDIASVIPTRTLERRLSAGSNLKPEEADAIARLVRVVAHARRTFEKNDIADEFLHSPNPVLGNRIPIDMAVTDLGAREVEAVLTRIEYGVYS